MNKLPHDYNEFLDDAMPAPCSHWERWGYLLGLLIACVVGFVLVFFTVPIVNWLFK